MGSNGGRRAKKPIHYELLRGRFGKGEKWHQGCAVSRGDELQEAPQILTAMVPISSLILKTNLPLLRWNIEIRIIVQFD